MMKKLLIYLLLFFELTSNDVLGVTAPSNEQLILRGRVIFPKGTPPPIEHGAKLYIQLQDTALQDVASTTVAKTMVSRVKKFPVSFTLRYTAKDVADALKRRNKLLGLPESATSNTYSIDAVIKGSDGKSLLFLNDMMINVKPLGNDRTKTIDVPVIAVKKYPPIGSENNKIGNFKEKSFPEVVGKNVDEAIKIIKEKTGFTNVVGMKEGTPMTLDLRNDRVRVIYNDKRLVTQVPFIA